MMGSLNPEGSVQQGTQTQGEHSTPSVCNCLAEQSQDPARQSPETPINLVGDSDSSSGPLGFSTPGPYLPDRIDWGNIELSSTEELAGVAPFLQETPPEFQLLTDITKKSRRKSTREVEGRNLINLVEAL